MWPPRAVFLQYSEFSLTARVEYVATNVAWHYSSHILKILGAMRPFSRLRPTLVHHLRQRISGLICRLHFNQIAAIFSQFKHSATVGLRQASLALLSQWPQEIDS